MILELLWDDWNNEHIARHGITPSEVEEVCRNNPWMLRAQGAGKRAALGQTDAGRYLIVILGDRGGGLYYPVTARDMNDSERRRYRGARGR